MFTGIVILNYNNAKDTMNCILSFERHNTAPVKYIVVDNGSSNPETVPELDAFFSSSFGDRYTKVSDDSRGTGELSPVTFLVSRKNDGYARGNNKGLELAYGDDTVDSILLVNNDILFIEDIVPVLIEETRALPSPGMISPILYKRDGKRIDYNCARYQVDNWGIILPFYWHNHKRDRIRKFRDSEKILLAHPEYLKERSFEIELPSGSCMFARKEVFQDVQGFDTGTFLYFEESILAAKLSRKGYVNYCLPGIHAVHLGAGTTSKSNNLFLQKCMLESANYYLRNYGRMTLAQRLVWAVTRTGWWATFAYKGMLMKETKKK